MKAQAISTLKITAGVLLAIYLLRRVPVAANLVDTALNG